MATGRRASSAAIEAADGLHSAAIHLLRYVRKEDATAGVTPARLSALSVVVFAGPKTLGELAAIEQVRPPTMTKIVSGLEDAGLVRRRQVRGDARSVRVEPTARGRALLQRARDRRLEALAARLRGLTREELETLRRAAVLIEEALGRPPAA